ncbi:uncharacterized protein LOC128456438 [Pleuronectes platessa]|uniref:uncharacterized protein LOC128456438 n=1 Tax=Pleuronectes platessa TaxID=8262 RepID=UPI00232A4627|nr:uncharacterized protein LOC128456438 [Pleuronectes platessa]
MATNNSSNPCVELHNLMPLGIRELTGTRERDQPPPASSQDSSCTCLTPPLLTSPLANSTKGQRGEEHGYSPVDPSPEQGLHRPERQEHVGLNGQTDNYSKLIRLLDESESLSARPVTPQHSVRLQLYNRQYQKFRDRQLLDPKVWKDIYYSRPGRVPNHQPYHHLGERYRELRATSTVAFASSARHRSHQWRVACGVTCYNHPEGPWCEVQSQDGTQICILAALPMSDTPQTAVQLPSQISRHHPSVPPP